jgi:hypothetical protein
MRLVIAAFPPRTALRMSLRDQALRGDLHYRAICQVMSYLKLLKYKLPNADTFPSGRSIYERHMTMLRELFFKHAVFNAISPK